MSCKNPIVKSDGAVRCRQCLPCRIATRREKTARILLEMLSNEQSWFVTLTYSPKDVPRVIAPDGTLIETLSPRDLKSFHKKLNSIAGSFRYYSVGEYGDRTQRPHYHSAIFSDSHFDVTKIDEAWDKGFVQIAPLTRERAAYTAGYVVKKFTKPDDPALLGRHPEFGRMSRRPGLGYYHVERIAICYESRAGAAFLARNGDIAHTFRFGGKDYPLDRYMRERLRERLGIPAEHAERVKANPKGLFLKDPPELIKAKLDKALHYGEKELRKRKKNPDSI